MKRLALAVEDELRRAGLQSIINGLPNQPFELVACVSYATQIRPEPGNEPELLLISTQKDPEVHTDSITRLFGCSNKALVTVLMCDSINRAQLSRFQKIGVEAVLSNNTTVEEILAVLVLIANHRITNKDVVISEICQLSKLTKKEQEVAGLIGSGMTNQEAAHAMSLSDKTVVCHLTKIYKKLGIHHRVQLLSLCAKMEGADIIN